MKGSTFYESLCTAAATASSKKEAEIAARFDAELMQVRGLLAEAAHEGRYSCYIESAVHSNEQGKPVSYPNNEQDRSNVGDGRISHSVERKWAHFL